MEIKLNEIKRMQQLAGIIKENKLGENLNEGRIDDVPKPQEKDLDVKDKYKKGDYIFFRVWFSASPMVANSKSEISKSVYGGRIDRVTKDFSGKPKYIVGGYQEVKHDMVIGAKKTIKEGNIDKELSDFADSEEAKYMENSKAFTNTTQGKNAVRVIKTLISKPYGYNKLDKVLQVLNLNKQNFIYAAKAAGMDFDKDAAGIHIYDDNYQDQDVVIDQINGEWIVG